MTNEERIDISEYGYDENKGIWSKHWEKFLTGNINKKGYVYVGLKCIDGKKRLFGYHRALWYLAYGAIPEGYEINHLDENKQNNRLSNLSLTSPVENCNWKSRNERIIAKRRKPVIALDKDGNVVHEFSSTQEAGRKGFSQTHVAACCRGEQQTHKGLIWRYAV